MKTVYIITHNMFYFFSPQCTKEREKIYKYFQAMAAHDSSVLNVNWASIVLSTVSLEDWQRMENESVWQENLFVWNWFVLIC